MNLSRAGISWSRFFRWMPLIVTRSGQAKSEVRACGVAGWAAQAPCSRSRDQKRGFRVKLIGALFVKPYIKSNKNDRVDAEAISRSKAHWFARHPRVFMQGEPYNRLFLLWSFCSKGGGACSCAPAASRRSNCVYVR
jgi:hypothetical protein